MGYKQKAVFAGLAVISVFGLFGCKEPSYRVVGDNGDSVAEHAAKRSDAIAFLLKTSVYVGEIRAMAVLPSGAELSVQANKMVALQSEADLLGNVVSPYSHCRGAGYKASEYWSTVAGNIRTESADSALAAYVEEALQCQGQVDNAPVAMTYIETDKGKNPPVEGCLKIVSLGSDEKVQEWSCPSGSLPKS